jgi:hypothetical protein
MIGRSWCAAREELQEVAMNEQTRKISVAMADAVPATTATHELRLPMSVFGGHLIVDVHGRKALVDTGCPVTLGTGAPLEVVGRSFTLHEDFFGITVKSIAESVGYPFDIVIGMDVIGGFDVSFSIARREIVIGTAKSMLGEALPVGNWFGAPTFPIRVNGTMHNVIFDTGAPISYLSERIVRGFEFVETRTDFFPLRGTFETDIYKVLVTIGATEKTLQFGAMNGVLAEMLEPSGMPGILGTEILRNTDVILAMAKEAITFIGRQAK